MQSQAGPAAARRGKCEVTAYEVTAVLTSTFVYEVRTPRSEVTAYVLRAHAHKG